MQHVRLRCQNTCQMQTTLSEHMLKYFSENISDELSDCMPEIVLHNALSTYANACVSVRMSEYVFGP